MSKIKKNRIFIIAIFFSNISSSVDSLKPVSTTSPLFRGRTLPRPLNWETLSRTIGGYQKINAQQTFSQLFELEIENLLQSLTLPNPFQSILILVCIEGNNNIFVSGPSYQFLVALF